MGGQFFQDEWWIKNDGTMLSQNLNFVKLVCFRTFVVLRPAERPLYNLSDRTLKIA
jgi:hypothetical protein